MLVALGFVLCALVVLIFGRVFWNLAVRLGASRNAKQIPVAMLELQADRDRLRVEHAMMARKLELRLQDIKMRMTEQMAEVSRSRNRVQTLVQDLATKTENLSARDRQITTLTTEIAAYKADIVSCTETIKHLTATNLSLEEETRKLTGRLEQAESTLKLIDPANNKTLQQLSTGTDQMAAVPNQLRDNTSEDRIKQRIHELTNLSMEMNNKTETRSPALDAPTEEIGTAHSTIDQKLADAEREANAMTEELRSLDKLLQATTAAPAAVVADETPVEPAKPSPMANVISLAQRIKALQFGTKE